MEEAASQILAIVPARAGSKGIPRKNLARVGDNTLIGHACRVAKRSPSVDRVVITSDDSEMGEEGLRNGANVFLRRPAHLATDDSKSADVWRHTWLQAEQRLGLQFGIAVWLQPTSPMRTVSDVETTIKCLIDTGKSACVTVSPVPLHFVPQKLLKIGAEGSIEPFIPESAPNVQRQDLQPVFWLNGHCYASRREAFLRDVVVIPDGAASVVIDRPVSNIDDLEDLTLARWLYSRQNTWLDDPL